MTSLALAPAPRNVDLPARLDALRSTLALEDLPLADAVDARDRAEVLRSYCRTARLGLEVANEASELRLRAERRCGAILIDLVPPKHQTLPPRTLVDLGISPKDSSRWQLLAKLPQPEFDARMAALKGAGVQVSAQPFLRAASQFARPVSGRPTTPTASLLKRALLLLKDVRILTTEREVDLARAVLKIGESWALVLEPKVTPTEWTRDVTCLLCGRAQPLGKPARCPACGGNWVRTH